jgi:hypothetical protein
MVDRTALKNLIDYIVGSVGKARAVDSPFYHLEFDSVFPADIYEQILAAKPVYEDYRPMSGRSKGHVRDDGTATRVKIDLFPEYIRALPSGKRELWDLVGRALCSAEVQNAFVRRFAKQLEKRFGANYANTGLYPIPILTRDIPGYEIQPHTDTKWKGITVQLFLPGNNDHTDVGTIFHSVNPDGSLKKAAQMKFARNSGYAFAVSTDTWHSADPVHSKIDTRDSILLTYFVDSGLLPILKNRTKRIGNFVRNEVRQLTRQ